MVAVAQADAIDALNRDINVYPEPHLRGPTWGQPRFGLERQADEPPNSMVRVNFERAITQNVNNHVIWQVEDDIDLGDPAVIAQIEAMFRDGVFHDMPRPSQVSLSIGLTFHSETEARLYGRNLRLNRDAPADNWTMPPPDVIERCRRRRPGTAC
jgi:hypothetical protein